VRILEGTLQPTAIVNVRAAADVRHRRRSLRVRGTVRRGE
jgi:hypothetical protein